MTVNWAVLYGEHCCSASCTYAFEYLYAVYESFLLCTYQMHFGPQDTHVIGCFLGSNVVVCCRSVGVRLGAKSWVIAPNSVHCARTVHPFPLCPNTSCPLINVVHMPPNILIRQIVVET